MNKIVLNISRIKTARKLTWQELAIKAGIKMRSWMAGGRDSPSEDELIKIAKALDVTVDELKR